jgi:hypothetical protein
MVKLFCDHSRREIQGKEHQLDDLDFPDASYMDVKKFFNMILCEECYHRRLQWHLDVDEVFFHWEEDNG